MTRKNLKSTIKEYLVLMSTGGRDWKLWELVALVLSVGAIGLISAFFFVAGLSP